MFEETSDRWLDDDGVFAGASARRARRVGVVLSPPFPRVSLATKRPKMETPVADPRLPPRPPRPSALTAGGDESSDDVDAGAFAFVLPELGALIAAPLHLPCDDDALWGGLPSLDRADADLDDALFRDLGGPPPHAPEDSADAQHHALAPAGAFEEPAGVRRDAASWIPRWIEDGAATFGDEATRRDHHHHHPSDPGGLFLGEDDDDRDPTRDFPSRSGAGATRTRRRPRAGSNPRPLDPDDRLPFSPGRQSGTESPTRARSAGGTAVAVDPADASRASSAVPGGAAARHAETPGYPALLDAFSRAARSAPTRPNPRGWRRAGAALLAEARASAAAEEEEEEEGPEEGLPGAGGTPGARALDERTPDAKRACGSESGGAVPSASSLALDAFMADCAAELEAYAADLRGIHADAEALCADFERRVAGMEALHLDDDDDDDDDDERAAVGFGSRVRVRLRAKRREKIRHVATRGATRGATTRAVRAALPAPLLRSLLLRTPLVARRLPTRIGSGPTSRRFASGSSVSTRRPS